MKNVKAVLEFEKDAPKTRAFGIRTKDGILIKVWVPKDMIKSRDTIIATLALGGKKGKVVEEEEGEEEDELENEPDFDDDDDVDDEDADEDEDEDEDEEEDEPAPKKRAAKRGTKKRR